MKDVQVRHEQIWLVVGSLMILATVALATAFVYTRDVMIPFVLAIFITSAVGPLVDFQVRRWRLPMWLAVMTTLFLVLVMLALIGFVLILAGQTMYHRASAYSDQVVSMTERMFTQLNEHLTALKGHDLHIEVDQAKISQELQARLPGVITATAGTVTAVVTHGFLIMFFAVFLLIGRNPHERRHDIYAEIDCTIRRYITTMTAIAAVTALLVGFVLWAFGLNLAWLFALLVFALTFIPSVGPIIATLLPIPVAVAQFQDVWMVLAIVAVPGAIHMLIGNMVVPKLMGSGLELHPVTVLLALAFWGLLWGIVGMVLAVPIVAMLRIILSHFSTTRPLANLLAGHLPGTGPSKPVKMPRASLSP
jgi:AI-2 transport protein TqsA